MKRSDERRIWKVLMHATEHELVPDGYYGPETCRWATHDEMLRFGLKDIPLVHTDVNGDIDCYFTETEAIVVHQH
jgi:hypothetical protein